MGISQTSKWTCDLCFKEVTIPSNVNVPDGWIKLLIEDSILDRCFHDKAICDNCLSSIKESEELIKTKKL